MKVERITQDEAYEALNTPFNPPLEVSCDEESFFAEWSKVRDGLKVILDQLGVWNAYGEGDYYLGDHASLSRGIGIELTSDSMLNAKLIPAVQHYLVTLEQQYEVHCSFCDDGGVWNLFMSSSVVKTDCPDSVLEKLL